jgi:hypothetical protein
MAIFAPNQREELIIGNAVASESTVSTFVASASNKELQLFSKDGSAITAGKNFYGLQKTSGSVSKGLNYEFTDSITTGNVTGVAVAAHKAEVQRAITVTGFTGTPQTNATYEVMIRLYNDGGAMSSENFRTISGFHVTNSDVIVENTNANIIAGIVSNLTASQKLEGDGSFVFTSDANSITITGLEQFGDPAKNIADQIEFDVQVSVKSNGNDPATSIPTIYSILTASVVTAGHPGVGTGKYVSNLEWFTRGYAYEAYRESGYPANFSQPDLYSNYIGAYNLIHINYYSKNSVVGVEEQYKTLSIAVEFIPGDNSSNAATNDVLGQLRVALGSSSVPVDLPVV